MNRNRYKISVLSALCLVLVSCGGTDRNSGDASVFGGNIVETGTLEAIRTTSFTLPRMQYSFGTLRIVKMVEHGAVVHPGDSLIQLDLSGVNQYIMDRQTNLENAEAAVEMMMVNNDNKIKSLETSLRNERASFALKQIEVDATSFESERTRQIKQLEFEQAKINIAQFERRIELTRIMNENDMKIQRIRLEQIEKDIRNANLTKSEYSIITQVYGVFQVGPNYRSMTYPYQPLKVGDEVYQGQPLGNVPELEYMKVITFINENDFLKIHEGQKVAVRLDATPNIVFDGEITHIGKLCHLREYGTGSRQKVFDVEVNILKSDERLKPGMTVSCEFLAGS